MNPEVNRLLEELKPYFNGFILVGFDKTDDEPVIMGKDINTTQAIVLEKILSITNTNRINDAEKALAP